MTGGIAPVPGVRRVLAVAARIDDEMLSADSLRYFHSVGDVDRSTEKIRDVETEPIGVSDAGTIQSACHVGGDFPLSLPRIRVPGRTLPPHHPHPPRGQVP